MIRGGLRGLRQAALLLLLAAPLPVAGAGAEGAMVAAARAQVGVTTRYDPACVRPGFPGGDVPRDRGVCTDVLIRALRDGWGADLQRAVNRDMRAGFARYPRTWGLKITDRNIDHRRVANLETLFTRIGAALPVGDDPAAFRPGDIVSWRLPGTLPHIGIVSDRTTPEGRPLILHNIGEGTREDDILLAWPVTGHFRLTGEAATRLHALGTE